MKNKPAIAPEYRRLPAVNLSFSRWSVALINVFLMVERWFARKPANTDIRRENIVRRDGSSLRLLIIKPRLPSSKLPFNPLPCIVYYHGGAFALTYSSSHLKLAQRYASALGSLVVFVDYRLMPDHPFPAGQDDCYDALRWTSANAARLGIDRARIALMGDSAGGALAASISQLAQDRAEFGICAQVLIYPATDADCKTASAREFKDTPIFTSASNSAMWRVYLHRHAAGEWPAYASPIHRADVSGLPRAYIETAEFDPLHDEGVAYAKRLADAGVEVTLNETRGTVHGFDAVVSSAAGNDAIHRRIEFLEKCFALTGQADAIA